MRDKTRKLSIDKIVDSWQKIGMLDKITDPKQRVRFALYLNQQAWNIRNGRSVLSFQEYEKYNESIYLEMLGITREQIDAQLIELIGGYNERSK